MESYDLVVIGGGAAGEKGAVQAAWFGKRVALIEKEPVYGGAMVNTGTLPSKTLRETALFLSGFRQRGLFGVDLKLGHQATVRDFLYRLHEVVAQERLRLAHNLERHGVALLPGCASFVNPHTLSIQGSEGERRVEAANVLIATGSTPNRPALFPFEHPRVYDSDEIVQVNDLPKTMAVVGAGVIGCEYACLFAALGARVTLLDSKPSILSFLDGEIARLLTARMKALGIEFRMPEQVKSCTATDASVALGLASGGTLDAELVLVCAGRQPATRALHLEAAGIPLNEHGQLTVDAAFRTQVPHIFAVGDVVGFPALASVSMEQARVAVVHCFDLQYKSRVASVFPYGIYTIPEVSMVGSTEEMLQKEGVDYVKGEADFGTNARGLIIGDEGKLKLLFRRSDMKLLGVHGLGEGATEWIHIGLIAMLMNAHADLFIDACFNYPTLSEAYKYATYDAMGRKEKRVP
jgi:NAD(P) transhydrogenase